MSKYETTAGTVTRADAYSKLMHHLSEAEDQCYVIAHLHKTEGGSRDDLLATGWRGVGQMLNLLRTKIIAFATNKLS